MNGLTGERKTGTYRDTWFAVPALIVGFFVAATLVAAPNQAAPGRPAAGPAAQQQHQPQPEPRGVIQDDFLERISTALSRVARVAKPSVVSVQTVMPRMGSRPERAAASGVIFDARGYIVTSNHVIEGASELDVTLADGRKLQASIVGTDPKTDVAVLRVNASQLVPAMFGDSSRVEVGNLVLAIGSPFRLSQTVSHGIVSATGRSDLDIEGMEYQNFIQTDAATNPGNSGGALVNIRGEVIGINTAIATGSGQFSGVAFATPSNTVTWAAKRIISGRPLIRGYLGVALSPLIPGGGGGVLLDRITPDSPADVAGLRAQDIVTAVDETKVADRGQFRAIIAELSPGARTTITVYREGQQRRLQVTVGEQPRDM